MDSLANFLVSQGKEETKEMVLYLLQQRFIKLYMLHRVVKYNPIVYCYDS